MKNRRVVVTGIGAITPIGNTLNEYWDSLTRGVSGADLITYFDTSNFKTKFACEIKGLNLNDYFDRKEIRKLDLFSQYAMIAVDEAIINSSLNLEKVDKDRIGVIWGSGIGGIDTLYKEIKENTEIPRYNPFFIPKIIVDIIPGHISIKYDFKGPNFSTVSACASSANAIIDSYNYILLGHSDIMITGGSEAAINHSGVGGFNALHALSTKNDTPKTASRPFDKDRDGFVLGEGAGSLVLEEYEHAKARGATIYAELSGVGLTADAYHITAPHPEGLGAISVMENCIKNAGMSYTDIDLINMHGTSTPLGDIAESKAIKHVFKEHLYSMNIHSTKSMTGHLLGAAGVIEAISSIMSINEGIVAPTINLNELDENIDPKINFTANKAQKRDINVAISNTFGFGGHNACLLFKKAEL